MFLLSQITPLNKIRKVISSDKNNTNVHGGKYKEVVKTVTNKKKKTVELNIDAFQHQESDDENEHEEFIAVENIPEKDAEKYQFNFENTVETEYVIDHKFSKHQSHIKRAGFFPMFDQLENFAFKILKDSGISLPFSETLKLFCKSAKLSDMYFMREIDDLYVICKELQQFERFTQNPDQNKIELLLDSYSNKSIRRRIYMFCQCPLKLNSENTKQKLAILRNFFAQLLYIKQVHLPGRNMVNYSIMSKSNYSMDDLK